MATSGLGLLALTYALVQGHQAGWTSPAIIGLVALALVAWAAFAAVEARAQAPMVDLSLFCSRVFTGDTLAMVL
jgi:hypothetical protein